MSETSFKTTVEWRSINWQKLEKRVYKLQKRIFRASGRGDVKTYRRLQKTLMKSWSARALAVRRVTQDNQGKKTAGVDGVKSLTPKQRLELTGNLNLGTKVSPTRRVWIPKPGTDEKRPLGIPTMKDRALQSLVKLALEPEWEARFEPNSYGFRPGRSCHDAIQAFATRKEGLTPLRLLNHADTPIVRHVKVKGESSPYDGNLVYWSTRMGNNPEMPNRISKILKKQKGKCTHCEMFFREDDVLEVDHKIPKSQGGRDSYDNWQLLHRHCHDTKTANDSSIGTKSGCNSAEPKPTRKLERVKDKWVMRYA